MAFVEINWQPPRSQLRQFGWVCLIALPLLGWFFTGRHGPASWTPTASRVVGALAAVGLLAAVVGTVKPELLRPVFIGACLLAFPIGLVVGEVLFFAIYALVFTPMALVFKLIGRDSLDRRLEPNSTSYYSTKRQPDDVRRYFRQF